MPSTVFALEHLGNESIVIAEAPDRSKIRAVVPAGFSARIGETLHLALDPAMVRLFDDATGRPVAGK